MSALELVGGEAGLRIVQALGRALVHFLWQGALIAAALEAALALARQRPASERYLLRCGALLAMAAAPAATFLLLVGGEHAATDARTQAPAAAASGLDALSPWIVLAWAAGAALLGARLSAGWLRVRRLCALAPGRELEPEWRRRFDALCAQLGARAVARVVEGAGLAAPTVVGWLKPVVLVPTCVLTGLNPAQIEALLAHELAHVRRRDYLVNLVQSALEALLFYHPAVWWVSRGIRAEREFCCDDVAVALTRDRLAYARALTALESWRGAAPGLSMSTSGGPLMRRIRRLIGAEPAGSRPAFPALGALLAAALIAGAFGLAPAAAAQDEGLEELRARHERIRERLADIERRLEETRALLEQSRERGAGEAPQPPRAGEEWVSRIHEHLQRSGTGAEGWKRMVHEHLQRALEQEAGAGRWQAEVHRALEQAFGSGAVQGRIRDVHEHLQRTLEEHGGAEGWQRELHEHLERALEQGNDAAGQARRLLERSLDTGGAEDWKRTWHEHLQGAIDQHGGAADWKRTLHEHLQGVLGQRGDGEGSKLELHEHLRKALDAAGVGEWKRGDAPSGAAGRRVERIEGRPFAAELDVLRSPEAQRALREALDAARVGVQEARRIQLDAGKVEWREALKGLREAAEAPRALDDASEPHHEHEQEHAAPDAAERLERVRRALDGTRVF